MFHPGILIFAVVFSSYMVVTIGYVGYINYFEHATRILSYSAGVCSAITMLCLLFKGQIKLNRMKKVQHCFGLLIFTVVLAILFRLGPVGNIAVIYHMAKGEKVVLMTQVTRSNNDYFIYRRCRGKLDAFVNSNLMRKTLCGISFEDWKTLQPNSPILLIGTQSRFGLSFERYALLPLNSPLRELSKYAHFSGVVYLKRSAENLQINTTKLNKPEL